MTPRPELELIGDRTRGHGVVTGDHPDVDAGVEGDPHRLLGLGPQRVDDADQRDQQQVVDRGHRIRASRAASRRRRDPDREREDPQPLFRQLLVGGEQLVAHLGDRDLVPVPEGVAAPLDDDVGRALHRHEVRGAEHTSTHPVGPVVERRHELVVGVERHLGRGGERGAGLLGAHAHLGGEHHEGGFGRIADDRPVVADGGVAGEHQTESQAREVGHAPPAVPRIAPVFS